MLVVRQKLERELALRFLHRLNIKARFVHSVVNRDFFIFAADCFSEHSNVFKVLIRSDNASRRVFNGLSVVRRNRASWNCKREVFLAHTKGSYLEGRALLLDNLGARCLSVSSVKFNIADGNGRGKLSAAPGGSEQPLVGFPVIEEITPSSIWIDSICFVVRLVIISLLPPNCKKFEPT